jgi:hypothetical protein
MPSPGQAHDNFHDVISRKMNFCRVYLPLALFILVCAAKKSSSLPSESCFCFSNDISKFDSLTGGLPCPTIPEPVGISDPAKNTVIENALDYFDQFLYMVLCRLPQKLPNTETS